MTFNMSSGDTEHMCGGFIDNHHNTTTTTTGGTHHHNISLLNNHFYFTTNTTTNTTTSHHYDALMMNATAKYLIYASYGIIFLLGVLGNMMVIYVIGKSFNLIWGPLIDPLWPPYIN